MWFFSRSNQCTGNGGNKGSETILTKKNRATPQKNTLSSIELPNVSAHSQVAEGEGGNPAHTLVFGAGDGKQVTFLNETKERFGILVVDDHPVMRDGLRAVIEQESDMEVTGEAADGKDAIEQFRKLLPDVMLIDLQMPVMDGLQAITTIRSEFPDATIIVLTTFPGDARVVRAFTLGATSYLLKTARREEIIKAIRSEATARQQLAVRFLKGVTYAARPASHHLWVPLPRHLDGANLIAHLLRNGLAVVGEDAFAVDETAPPGIRISLGAARNRADLSHALQVLAQALKAPVEAMQIV